MLFKDLSAASLKIDASSGYKKKKKNLRNLLTYNGGTSKPSSYRTNRTFLKERPNSSADSTLCAPQTPLPPQKFYSRQSWTK